MNSSVLGPADLGLLLFFVFFSLTVASLFLLYLVFFVNFLLIVFSVVDSAVELIALKDSTLK